jgi:6-pyruvoyl-tetrahydropterin synthase
MDKLIIKELTFSAAHYIPGHPKCGTVHGHTFFLRNILIDCNKFVDFGDIKQWIATWDHVLIIPRKHSVFWQTKIDPLLREIGIHQRYADVDGEPTCEDISKEIRKQLELIKGVLNISFELYEGSNQGVVI